LSVAACAVAADAHPFIWTAFAQEILAKLRLVQTRMKKPS
jgi:hypothetical protein